MARPAGAARASTRGLIAEDPVSFHARQVNLHLPGEAEYVLSGQMAATGTPGSIVLCGDQARFSRSAEFAALVVPSGDDTLAVLRIEPGATPPHEVAQSLGAALGTFGLNREGGALAAYVRRNRGNPLDNDELDRSCERASELLVQAAKARGLISGSSRNTHEIRCVSLACPRCQGDPQCVFMLRAGSSG